MSELALSGEYNGVQCVYDQTYDDWQRDGVIGCGSQSAYLFFYSFVYICQFVLVNLFVAMMITGFMNANSENHGHVTAEDYNILIEKWKEYDPNATGWIDP